jgi:hypothetical protein
MEDYVVLGRIGEGAHGIVMKGRHKASGQVSMLKNFFPSSLSMRPNKQEGLYLEIIFKSSLTFAGNTRSLPKKEASERHSNWVCSDLALKF